MTRRRFYFISYASLVIQCSILAHSANSQIIPDRTTNTSVENDCQSGCEITGGVRGVDNLFHSFDDFSLGAGESAYFADPGVSNIFSRVTGNNVSNISGTLGVSGGDANLWLLNPNGIIFGAGAALDVNGSFVATTADGSQFGNDGSFDAVPNIQEDLSLLSVNPSALFFNQMGQNGSILSDGAELAVSPKQNVALLGKQVNNTPGILLKNSQIFAPQGKISLGAINHEAEISINPSFELYSTDENILLGDITLQNSLLEASGIENGSIYLQGNLVTLSQESEIRVDNLGDLNNGEINLEVNDLVIKESAGIYSLAAAAGDGADINIQARESISVTGKGDDLFQEFIGQNLQSGSNLDVERTSTIEATTAGLGNSGNLNLTAQNLTVDSGARVVSSTGGEGDTGNININVADTFNLRSAGLLTGSTIYSSGKVGKVNIHTERLFIEQGAAISSSTLGGGDAGSITIQASNLIEIKDTPANAVLPTGIFTNTIFGKGKGGDISIDTAKVRLQNGGQITASNGAVTTNFLIPFGGDGGNITIDATDFVEVAGISAGGNFPSSILSDTRTDNAAGNLTIHTGSLSLGDLGFISTSSVGTGDGGDIMIHATEFVELSGSGVSNLQQLLLAGVEDEFNIENVQGGIGAYTLVSGDAGNITIDTPEFYSNNGAFISTATFSDDDAGNLQIIASEKIELTASAIISPTFGGGNGGDIELSTKNLSLTGGSTVASASVGSGNAGNLQITAIESVEIAGTVPLLFSGSISTGSYRGMGSSGDLTLNTQRLSIRDGSNIETSNVLLDSFAATDSEPVAIANTIRDGGKLIINASELIEISGFATVKNPYNPFFYSHISSTTNTATAASDIEITTGKLSLSNRGAISVNSLGRGAAGSLTIDADSITLADRGNLNATTFSGQGGNIDLQVNNLLLLSDRSSIDTNAIGTGNGGNIQIESDFVVARENSNISANAVMGNGGNIQIDAKDLFITFDSQISASSELGIEGNIDIKTFDVSERNNLFRLPEPAVRVDRAIVQSCGANNNSLGVFSYTGKGGLPINPLTEVHHNNPIVPDLNTGDRSNLNTSNDKFQVSDIQLNSLAPKIVEAQNWQVNQNGKIELTAANSSKFNVDRFSCPFER